MKAPSKFRVLVTGGRNYSKHWRVYEALETLLRKHSEGIVVIEGGALGADAAASLWAHNYEAEGLPVEHLQFKANWTKYRKDAGNIRNGEMLREGKPDLVLAFPGGRGTQNMMTQARYVGVEVVYGEEFINAE